MVARANWKGYLKLSLVSCAVALYPATSSSSRIRFNTLNRETGNRIKLQKLDSVTGEVVEPEDTVKGYPVAKNSYVTVEEDELEAIKLESTHTIEIESFVPREEVDERYLEAPYYIVPDDQVAQEAFAVIRDAMRDEKMVGLGRVVMGGRERIVLLEPLGKGILGTLLRYGYEVRDEKTYFEDIPDLKLPAEMRDLARHIIERKATNFDPSRFEDRYEAAVAELVKSKQSGEPAHLPSAPKPPNVINLMEALRRSIGAEKAPAKKATPKRPAPSRGKSKAPAAKRQQLKKAS